MLLFTVILSLVMESWCLTVSPENPAIASHLSSQCGRVTINHSSPTTLYNHKIRRRNKRIYNGEHAYHTHPWTAALMFKSAGGPMYWCAATLVSPTHVVTAQHCLDMIHVPDDVFIKVGAYNLNIDEASQQDREVKKIIKHPDYRFVGYDYDIAVIELTEPVVFNEYVQPACLPSKDDPDLPPGTMTTTLGWGFTATHRAVSESLDMVQMPMMSTNNCSAWVDANANFVSFNNATMICTSVKDNKSVCSGDSGGPLLWKNPADERWYLRGVVNGLLKCGKTPTYFANVKYYSNWIK